MTAHGKKVLLLILAVVTIFFVIRLTQGPQRPEPTRSVPATKSHQWASTPRPAPRIVFKDSALAGSQARTIAADKLTGLHDAVTGLPLDPARGLYRCGRCFICYHTDSYQLLREQNEGRCVGCGGVSIAAVKSPVAAWTAATAGKGRDHQAGITTLADYRSKTGQVVIFEGQCLRVLRSQRGLDYAAMFEPGTWSRGFKMVVFGGALDRLGGAEFVQSLVGRRVRVRGLVVYNRRFGYEIVVNDRSMILGVA